MDYPDARSDRRCPLDPLRRRGDDGAPLSVEPMPGITRADVEAGTRSQWRYRDTTVVVLTGSGLKAAATIGGLR